MRLSAGSKRDAAVAVAIVLGAAVVLYPRAMLRGEIFFERDLHLNWYPRIAAIARSLRLGAWPLWDPGIAFGQPLLADPGAEVAYPGTWLALLAPAPLGYTFFVLFHLVLTAIGALRLGRALRASRAGELAIAVVWLLGGPLQSALNLWHHFAGACWMPWLLLAVDRAVRRPGRRATVWLGVVGGLQALAGSADVCAMSWAAAVVWGLARADRRALGSAARSSAVGFTLAVGLAAVVWCPAADLVSRSSRRNLPADVRTAWSVPAAGLMRLVAPLDPGLAGSPQARWRELYGGPGAPLLRSLYVGSTVVVLAVVALADRRQRRAAAVLAALSVAAVAFALGPHGPVYELAAELFPPLRSFRYPSKALLLAALTLAAGAGLGVGALSRARLSRRGCAAVGAGLLAAVAAATVAARGWGTPPSPWPWLAAAAAAPIGLCAAGALRPRPAALAVVALVGGDLLAPHASLNATAPADLVFRPPPLVGAVDRDGGRRLYVYDYHSLPGTSEHLLGRPDPYRYELPPPGVDPRQQEVLALRLYLPPPSAALFGLEGSYDVDIRGLYPAPLHELVLVLRSLEGTPAHARLLRMGAVGTVASLHSRGLEDLRPRAVLPSLFPEPIRVWSVPGAPARSWVVGCSRVADGREALEALVAPGFDPRREVLLPEGTPRRGPCDDAGESRRVASPPDRVRIEATLTRPGFVVVADSWDPNWRATVDGEPAPLLRANVAFRAVAVAPGRHVVEMAYRPRAAIVGLVVSLLSLAAAVAIRGSH